MDNPLQAKRSSGREDDISSENSVGVQQKKRKFAKK